MSRNAVRRSAATVAIIASATLAATACTNSTSSPAPSQGAAQSGANDAPGKKVTIGFSAPAADHGWMAAITAQAKSAAGRYGDVEFRLSEGTADASLQISQVETFINDKVDAIVILPIDGGALTQVAQKATDAGIPVVNVDRRFESATAARTTILGDNYGMGQSAGRYVCTAAKGRTDAVVAEIPGIDSLPLTQDRSRGFRDALARCGLKVTNRVAADFTVEGGERAASNLLQAAPKIDSSGTTTTTRASACSLRSSRRDARR
ncbi:substrate-binding domain-containing protein [Tsukamurella strandjordii]|nr:hypothetical protein TTY48_33840 [Tsukamurella sp. TY48]